MTSARRPAIRPRRRAHIAGPAPEPDPPTALRPGSTGYQRVPGDRGITWDNASRACYDGPYWLFQYTVSGGGWFRDGARTHRLRPGEAFVTRVPAETGYGLELGRRWEWMWCSASGPMAEDQGARVLAAAGPLLEIGTDPPAHRLAAWYEAVADGEVGAWRATALCTEFWCGLLEWIEARQATFGDPLQRARRHVDEYFADPACDVEAAAAAAGVSRYHLARLCRERGEEPLGERIRRRRLESARRWLLTTDAAIATVAARSGFSSSAHFCAAFRRRYGTTPGRFRS